MRDDEPVPSADEQPDAGPLHPPDGSDGDPESLERLRLALDIGGLALWEWHPADDRFEWSSELERVHGLQPGTFGGSLDAYRQYLHPDDCERVIEGIRREVAAGRGPRAEYRVVRPIGEIRWLRARGRVISGTSGEPVRVVGVCEDVTERREAEDALRDQWAFLRAVIDASPNLVFAKDREGRFTLANEAVARAYGTTPEDLVGKTDAAFNPDEEEVERFRRDDLEVIESGQPKLVREEPVTDAAGVTRWYQTRKVPLETPYPDSTQVLGIATDITERRRAEQALRESEERYRMVMRAMNDLAYDWDIGTGEVLWEGPVMQVLGYEKDEMDPDFDWWEERLHPEDRGRVGRELGELLDGGGEYWSGEYRFHRRDGSYAILFDRGYITRDAEGRPIRMVGSVMDMTERRRMQERLHETQKMRVIGRLAGSVAHEFNNSLMGIKGNAQLLLMDLPADGPMRTELEEIEQATDHMATLTRKLLAFGGRRALHSQAVDLNESIASMEAMLRRLAGGGIEVVLRLDPALERVNADPSLIEELVLALVLNAQDAMPDGGTLILRTRAAAGATEEPGSDASADMVRFSVSDTGIGMDEETRRRAAEPFFTTKGNRRGFGLTTVYAIVEQCGGAVVMESAPEEGSTFTILLPVASEDTGDQGPAARPAGEGGSETILLVEDDEQALKLARRVLERGGYRVLEAASAEEALRIPEERLATVRLLLTDVLLPGMKGPALARQLAARRPGMPIIFMSGYTAEELHDQDLLAPGVSFIPKPFDVSDLLLKVREAIGVGS